MFFSFYPVFSLLFSTIILGTIIRVSANRIFIIWIGLEINLISFLPLILLNQHFYSSISAIKYFLTQSTASIILLISFLTQSLLPIRRIIILIAIIIKAGLPPYHFWFPSVIQSTNWFICLILSTWQKLAPLTLIFFIYNKSKLFLTLILLSLFISSIGGISQTKLRPLIAYSSIGHISWILRVNIISITPAFLYLIFYLTIIITIFSLLRKITTSSLYKFFKLNTNIKSLIITAIIIFSLRGLPPFVGFFLKWIVLESILKQRLLLAAFLILSSIINLSYYLNLIFSIFFFQSSIKAYKHSPIFIPFFTIVTIISTPNIFIYAMIIFYKS